MSGEFPEDWFRPGSSEEHVGEDGVTPEAAAEAGVGDSPADAQSSPDPRSISPSTAAPSPGSPEVIPASRGSSPLSAPAPPGAPTSPARPVSPGAAPAMEMAESAPSLFGAHADADAWAPEEPESTTFPVLTSARAARTVDMDEFLPSAQRRGVLQRRLWLFLVSVVALALVVGLAGGTLIRRSLDAGAAPSPSSAGSATGGSARVPWAGPTAVLAAADATASCTAPAGTDASGQYVTYAPENTLDELLPTAWRCDGDSVGQRLQFTFDSNTTLVGVGMVNGYAKNVGDVSLYDQYRRVVSVRWDLPDGSWFTQNLSENSRSVQQVMIPPVPLDGPVSLTILESTAPGKRGDVTRDAVLISSVRFLTKG